jgi:hypothetical protein
MRGDIKSHNLPAIVGQDDYYVQQPKRRRCNKEYIDGGDAFGLIAQRTPPAR